MLFRPAWLLDDDHGGDNDNDENGKSGSDADHNLMFDNALVNVRLLYPTLLQSLFECVTLPNNPKRTGVLVLVLTTS